MSDEDLKKLDDARSNYRQTFDQHFESLTEAKEVEALAFAGDDKAMARLWLFYQDGEFHSGKTHGSVIGGGGFGPVPVDLDCRRLSKVDCDVANKFRELATSKFNPDALDFLTSVQNGNRSASANYPLLRDKGLMGIIQRTSRVAFFSKSTSDRSASYWEGPSAMGNPHMRYRADALLPVIVEYENTSLSELEEEQHGHIPKSPASSICTFDSAYDVSSTRYAQFLGPALSKTIPALEICAKAGDASAANELEKIYSTNNWGYKTQYSHSSSDVSNPEYSLGKADYWKKITEFLEGKGDTKLLDSFILSQDKASDGLYNIGVALFSNEHMRKAYNMRLGRKNSDLTAAYDFMKSAANMGNANAAWYLGDRFQTEAEKAGNDSEKLRQAISWYKTGEELGHPGAKCRCQYLSKKNQSITALDIRRSEASNPSEAHIQKYPHAMGHMEVRDVDYSFLFDGMQGGLLERLKRAQKLSDGQVAQFSKIVASLEAKIAAMLLEADIKAGRANAIDAQREAGFVHNTQSTRNIGKEERLITAERDRWRKEQVLRLVTGTVITILTQGADQGIKGLARLGHFAKNSSAPLVAGSRANTSSAIELRKENIANLTAQLADIGLLDEQQKQLMEELERLNESRFMVALQKDAASTQRLFQGYLRQQILEMGVQNCECSDDYARRIGLNSVDGFLDAFERDAGQNADKKRIHGAIRNFCIGAADTNDLHLMLAYSDTLGKKAESGATLERHEQALYKMVERQVKPAIESYASKSSRMDVLKEVRFTLAPAQGKELVRADDQNNAELGALMQANFATEGSDAINRVFDFYLHRHGNRTLRETRLNDGQVSSDAQDREKRVLVLDDNQKEMFIEHTIDSYKNSTIKLPQVNSVFLRVCAAEYFEPQSVITYGQRGSFKENPQAPVAYPMVNDVVNEFISKMSLSPIGKYREVMKDKNVLDALVAQSFIDFFAVLGQTHVTKFEKERSDLVRANELRTYGTRFRSCYNTITDHALEQYDLFKDIFAQNLQKTLDVETTESSKKLLKDLEEIKKMGFKGLDPENIIIPGTPEALERSLRRDRRFENMHPPLSGSQTKR